MVSGPKNGNTGTQCDSNDLVKILKIKKLINVQLTVIVNQYQKVERQ